MKQESYTVSCEHELGHNGQTILLTIEKSNKIQNKFANNKNPPYLCNREPKIYLFMTYEQYLESKKERVAQSGFSISDDELNSKLFPYNKGML